MKPLLSALNDIPEYRSLLAAIDNGACPAAFSGLSAVHRAHFAAGIRQELNRPVVVVCADEGEAERMARDLAALSGEAVRTLSAREFTFHNAAVVSRQYEHRRLSTLRALAAGECPLLVSKEIFFPANSVSNTRKFSNMTVSSSLHFWLITAASVFRRILLC